VALVAVAIVTAVVATVRVFMTIVAFRITVTTTIVPAVI